MESGLLTHEKAADESVRTLVPGQVEDERPDFLKDCEHREKELMRKIDWRLLPVSGIMYAVALIDRVNVGIRA